MANLSRLPTPVIEQWEWQYDGLCRSIDPEVFFPPDSERGPVRQRRELQAKKYCEQCPVLARCREHALSVQEPYGVWGGLTPRERDRILHEPGQHDPGLPEPRRREAGMGETAHPAAAAYATGGLSSTVAAR
jgi:WhiB family transcriptional regulator, redox-sensing transcriptional regulator